MADDFGFTIISKPVTDYMTDTKKRTDRASMYGLRAVGRLVKQRSQRAAPKVSGAYKSSIKSSRNLKRTAAGWSVTIAPRGAVSNPSGVPIYLYAGKVEAQHAPMRTGYDAAVPEMGVALAKAWAKAMQPR